MDKNMFETFRPSAQAMQKLVAAARNHPLGTEFLLQGDLCAVASLFGTHVFTVEAVRDHWDEIGLMNTQEGEKYGI